MFDFEQNKEVADLTAVPTNLHSFYEKKDAEDEASPFQLKQGDPTVSAAINLATGLHQALKSERNKKATKIDLTPLQEYGTEPAAIVEAFNTKVTNLEAQIQDNSAYKTQVAEMKTSMTAAHETAMAAQQAANAQLTNQLDEYMINTQIAVAATNYPGLRPELIAPFAKQHMKVDVDGETGQRTVVVLDRDGNTRFSMDRPTERANVSELLGDMSKQDQYLQLFPSDARRGADTKPSAGQHQRPGTHQDNSPSAKIARGLNKGR